MVITYVKGSHNVIVDDLSHSPILDLGTLKQDKVITLLPKEIWLPDSSLEKLAQIVTDKNTCLQVLTEAHDHILSGHPGIAQTIRNLSWEGKANDVAQYVKCCPECQ